MQKVKCFIDVETTGLNPEVHEIIEICIVRCVENMPAQVWVEKIAPKNIDRADSTALQINRFTWKSWADAREEEEAAEIILEMTAGATLIGHNVRFDEAFISELLHRHDMKPKYSRRLIDTVALAHEHIEHIGSLSMDNIREYYNWSLAGAHSARKDALDCMRLYNRLCRCSALSRLWWRLLSEVRILARFFNKMKNQGL